MAWTEKTLFELIICPLIKEEKIPGNYPECKCSPKQSTKETSDERTPA